MGYMYDGNSVWWGIIKLIMFILGTFIFSFIFWATKKWMDSGKCSCGCCTDKKKK